MNRNELPRLENYSTHSKETLTQWYPHIKEEKNSINKPTVTDKPVQNKISEFTGIPKEVNVTL